MKYYLALSLAAMSLMTVSSSQAAISVRTSIDVQAEISTSVRVYVAGNDVTNGSISLKLNDKMAICTVLRPPLILWEMPARSLFH